MSTDRSDIHRAFPHLSRRRFVALAALAAAAPAHTTRAAASAPAPPAAGPAPGTQPAPRRELGFYVAPGHPKLAERLAWLAERGVRHVGLDGGGPTKPADIARVAGTLRRAGMEVVALHGWGSMAHPENDQQALYAAHLAYLDRAAAYGAAHLIVHFRVLSLPWREGVGADEAAHIARLGLAAYDARVLELLAWLSSEAARRGNIRIALENLPCQHRHSHRVEEIVALIERSGAPNVVICLDTGHVHASGLDVAAAVRAAGRHLATTHLHDNLGGGDPNLPISKTDLHFCVGLGTINWPATIRALDTVGYRGPAVFEGTRIAPKTPRTDDWEKSVSMCIDNFRAAESLAAEAA